MGEGNWVCKSENQIDAATTVFATHKHWLGIGEQKNSMVPAPGEGSFASTNTWRSSAKEEGNFLERIDSCFEIALCASLMLFAYSDGLPFRSPATIQLEALEGLRE